MRIIVGVVCGIVVLAVCLVSLDAQENMGRGRVKGQVVDNSGNPIEDALIVAQSLEGTAMLEGKSDSKGNFAIAGLGTGKWRFTATKKGYAQASVDQRIRQLRSNTPIQFVLEKLTGIAAFQADPEAQDMFEKGNSLFEEGRYDEAIQVFEQFTEAYPEIYQARLNIAMSLAKKGDFERAEAEYKDVLEKVRRAHGELAGDKTTSFRGLSGLGEICLARQDFEGARDYFRLALALSPEDETAAYNLGEILFSSQHIDEAINYFKMAIRIKPSWSKPYYKLGLVYLNKEDYDNSLEYFKKFIEIDPENPEVPIAKNIMDMIAKMKKNGRPRGQWMELDLEVYNGQRKRTVFMSR